MSDNNASKLSRLREQYEPLIAHKHMSLLRINIAICRETMANDEVGVVGSLTNKVCLVATSCYRDNGHIYALTSDRCP